MSSIKMSLDCYTVVRPDATMLKMIHHPELLTVSDFEDCQSIYDVEIGTQTHTRTIIMIAVRFGMVQALKLMLTQPLIRALMNVQDEHDWTALMLAAKYPNITISNKLQIWAMKTIIDAKISHPDFNASLILFTKPGV